MKLKRNYDSPQICVEYLSVSDTIFSSISWGTDKESYEDLPWDQGGGL